jgi:N-acetylglutamate synthase-like GNAT family acetyltransferase
MHFETQQNGILISTDKSKLNLQLIHDFLANQSYWAANISIEIVEKSIENSVAFGVYKNNQQIGFCRIISDFATFAYLADVFIVNEFRGQGISKLLVESIFQHPDLQGLRRFLLATQDAHGLYAKFGFKALDNPDLFMQIKRVNPYQKETNE